MGSVGLSVNVDAPHAYVDEGVLHRIAFEAEWVPSPYTDVETLVVRVASLYSFLVDVARERARTDYGAVARECNIHAARQDRVLGILVLHESQYGRPLLPALVTEADRETPGDAYFRTVERAPDYPDELPVDAAERRWIWETHREAVYREWAESYPRQADGRSTTSN